MIDEEKAVNDEVESLEGIDDCEFTNLISISGYESYSQWRIKEILREIGVELQPIFLGYKALRYRPCQRYFMLNIFTGEKIGNSYNGYSYEDLRYILARCGFPLHGENYRPPKPAKDEHGRYYACDEFLRLVENLPDEGIEDD